MTFELLSLVVSYVDTHNIYLFIYFLCLFVYFNKYFMKIKLIFKAHYDFP